jgi:hypothetical protein
MSLQLSLGLTLNVISSPESVDGLTPSGSQDGQKTDQYGQEAALANLSPQQAREKGLLTSGTYGQRSFGSSNSVSLQQSLVSRLAANSRLNGGILWQVTWSQKTTPALRLIFRLQASARSISDIDCSGWPTPKVQNKNAPGEHGRGGKDLQTIAQATHWPTPRASENVQTNLDEIAKQGSSWLGQNRGATVATMAQLCHWSTPASRDYRSASATEEHHQERAEQSRGKPLSEQAYTLTPGQTQSGSLVQTEKRGQLNAAFSRWLMGYPREWCETAIRAHRTLRQK